ncbi:HlyD family type I secretion periplasmic adaptor subunit [Bradyrhizobium tropiciagri]|uniref:HlyD family type I secretion periplasmic adaptor subunit n=1 Tax=Bradyrhizobium tropiciagri TaxID=312253 RepID=UPI001BAD9095|nr:HlyD family type I secretion periplasmic adaptor subunit [Bradyrhizobium tropiciagri]MBR0900705.1 HlyD family type I secretion periplasmic adaptor subunit [Bradyrhizobium tropiciagri]
MKSSELRDNVVRLPWLAQHSRQTQLEFLPAALEIVDTPASPASRAIAGTIILLILVALVWSMVGHVDIVAAASGKVVPTGRTKTVQPLETGIVTQILVRDGDHVTAGQIVMRLDQTIAAAERNHVAHDLLVAQLDVARLSALRAVFETSSDPDEHFSAPAEAPAPQVARARAAMIEQAAAQANKVAALDEQIAQKTAEAEEIAATIAKLEASLPFIVEEADVRRNAMAIEFGNKIAHLDAQIRLADQKNELLVQQRKAAESVSARRALQRQREQAKSEYANKVLSDLADAEQKVAGLKEDTVKGDQKLEQQLLRAPVDGTVQQLAVHSVGGVVTPAQQVMMIVPEDSHIEVEAMVPNRDIGFVSPGQEAEIKVDTFNFTRYGLLHGKVLAVSHDAIVRDKPQDKSNPTRPQTALTDSSEPQGQEFVYAATIGLDQTQLDVDGRMVELSPGMAVTVEIKTGSRRVIEYLLSPLLRYKHESLRER